MEVTDTVTVALVPGARESDEGDAWIAHGAACVTFTANVAVCEIEPLVPVTVIVLVPILVAGAAAN